MVTGKIPAGTVAFDTYYRLARRSLLDLFEGPAPQRVLEIGCGAGENLVLLKRRFPGCEVVGVEYREEAVQLGRATKEIDQIRQLDVQTAAPSTFESGYFDLLVLSHVLEHFVEPEAILQLSLRWVREGGHVLIALPNVRHVSVLWDLALHDEFRYRPSGILDRSHLRFYTHASACRLIEGAGLKTVQFSPEFGGRKSVLLNRLSFGLAQGFAAYAYNFLTQKP